jgi:hypothetical protein
VVAMHQSPPEPLLLGRRVAYLHLPKTGGSSVGHSLARSNVTACKLGTGNIPLCACDNDREGLVMIQDRKHCRSRKEWLSLSRVAIMECTFEHAASVVHSSGAGQWLWFAAIREPESFFYSAVGHFCSNFGRMAHGRTDLPLQCGPNVTLHTLLKEGWFNPTLQRGVNFHYYFRYASLQSMFLGNFFLVPEWLICDVSQLQVLHRTMARALGTPLQLVRDNVAVWDGLGDFRRRVPWVQVRRFFVTDEALHAVVRANSDTACLGRVSLPSIKAEIDGIAAARGSKVRWLD